MLRRAFEAQLAGDGLSIVEVLSTCPVGWGMTPSRRWTTSPTRSSGPTRWACSSTGRGRCRRGAADDHADATIFSGFGGQGLLFAGHVLAQAAVLEGRHVSWMPSYGPEMRGGTASCTVIVGDRPIGSPIVDRADSVIALNPPSLARFEPILAPGGLLVVNTRSLIEAEPSRDGCRGRVDPVLGDRPARPATTASSASSRSGPDRPPADRRTRIHSRGAGGPGRPAPAGAERPT